MNGRHARGRAAARREHGFSDPSAPPKAELTTITSCPTETHAKALSTHMYYFHRSHAGAREERSPQHQRQGSSCGCGRDALPEYVGVRRRACQRVRRIYNRTKPRVPSRSETVCRRRGWPRRARDRPARESFKRGRHGQQGAPLLPHASGLAASPILACETLASGKERVLSDVDGAWASNAPPHRGSSSKPATRVAVGPADSKPLASRTELARGIYSTRESRKIAGVAPPNRRGRLHCAETGSGPLTA